MQGDVKEQPQQEYRQDGYKNLMNKYGTNDDVSEHYRFESGEPVTDIELTINYEENGLFTKIIDIPADEAVAGGFSYGVNDVDLESFIDKSLEELNFEEQVATAIKWSRLYGGAVMVMLIDDGKELHEPVDWNNIHGIDELLVFERPLITPDYTSIYNYKPNNRNKSKFGMPQYYDISPMYGTAFRVHESRCLLFKNGILPSMSTRTEYRFFGIPEYVRIHKALQETITAHGNGNKLLDRAVQAIYKMKDLAELLSTDAGEDLVLQRLQIIDMARGIINSIAIDSDGEDYDFKSVSFSGVKEIIDSACNMLSAITNIPQTKLFGRSPAGENATGEGDMENYYKFVEKIQKLNLKNNMGTLIDVILAAGKYKGEFDVIPDYKLEFNPLWSLSETEKANVDQIKAATELTKAQTAQIYVDMQALDASEIRERLKENGEFTINDILEEEEEDWGAIENESEETSNTALSAEGTEPTEKTPVASKAPAPVVPDTKIAQDSVQPTGCGVIVVKDGKVLVGTRKDNGLICGPGGHIEPGETPEEAAIRETREEFGINIAGLVPVTIIADMPPEYCVSQVFLCTEYYGEPLCFNLEMDNARFETIEDVMQQDLFLPFRLSLEELQVALRDTLLSQQYGDNDISVDGGPGSGRYPKGSGEKDKKSKEEMSKKYEEINKRKKAEKEERKRKKQLNKPKDSGTIYAEEQIRRYAERPKELGLTTHREKYDDFINNGVKVLPLTQSNTLKNISYENGGGYKINDGQDGILSYHPPKGSHHNGEYYKVSRGKGGIKRYDMNGDPILE